MTNGKSFYAIRKALLVSDRVLLLMGSAYCMVKMFSGRLLWYLAAVALLLGFAALGSRED
ncbi:hypothetical protein [Lacticaseibacillus sharpeae]|uniref:hypothetical protein n=1 Tax=Lacticaseibacillus sharpeae TaxID=1626 RepID=UPI0006D091BF|nr:hypothetical protein [Lacticaseibacillus sharpeae]